LAELGGPGGLDGPDELGGPAGFCVEYGMPSCGMLARQDNSAGCLGQVIEQSVHLMEKISGS